jgi:fructokinase
VLEPNGPACYCGKRGCVETFLSGPGFARDYRSAGGDPLSAADIVARAHAGESAATAAIERYLDRFGRALAVVVNVLDPDAIVLGGGMSNLDALYTAGRERLAPHVMNDELRTPIRRNLHGDSSGVRGAACLWTNEE